jgi:hypothetical protein
MILRQQLLLFRDFWLLRHAGFLVREFGHKLDWSSQHCSLRTKSCIRQCRKALRMIMDFLQSGKVIEFGKIEGLM